MLRNYWKQFLIGSYVILVLFLSATARATTEEPNYDDELDRLEQIIESAYNINKQEVFSDSVLEINPDLNISRPLEDYGQFFVDNDSGNYVFISSTNRKIYEIRCENSIKDKIESGITYLVSGLDLSSVYRKEQTKSENSFFNSKGIIYVTSVIPQR
jgi:hypothetical protein